VEQQQQLERQLAEMELEIETEAAAVAGARDVAAYDGTASATLLRPAKPSIQAVAAKQAEQPAAAARLGSSSTPAASPARRPASSSTAGDTTTAAAAASKHGGGRLLPEVVDYDRFVARTGATGGWHADDHAAWLSALRRCKGVAAQAVVVAEGSLPMMTRPQIIAHARWHADLIDLDMRRRVALVAWRAARDGERAAGRVAALAAAGDAAGREAEQVGLSGTARVLILHAWLKMTGGCVLILLLIIFCLPVTHACINTQAQEQHAARDQEHKALRQLQRAAVAEWRERQRREAAGRAAEAAAARARQEAEARQQEEARRAAARARLEERRWAQEAAAQRRAEEAAVGVGFMQLVHFLSRLSSATPSQGLLLTGKPHLAASNQPSLLTGSAGGAAHLRGGGARGRAAARGAAPRRRARCRVRRAPQRPGERARGGSARARRLAGPSAGAGAGRECAAGCERGAGPGPPAVPDGGHAREGRRCCGGRGGRGGEGGGGRQRLRFTPGGPAGQTELDGAAQGQSVLRSKI
jgi:hypothetical protein